MLQFDSSSIRVHTALLTDQTISRCIRAFNSMCLQNILWLVRTLRQFVFQEVFSLFILESWSSVRDCELAYWCCYATVAMALLHISIYSVHLVLISVFSMWTTDPVWARRASTAGKQRANAHNIETARCCCITSHEKTCTGCVQLALSPSKTHDKVNYILCSCLSNMFVCPYIEEALYLLFFPE